MLFSWIIEKTREIHILFITQCRARAKKEFKILKAEQNILQKKKI